jgi:hypothetical protein
MSTRRRHWRTLALLVMLLTPAPASALTIRNLDVTQENGRYRVDFDVLVPVAATRVQALLGDYRQWPRLSNTLIDSRLLQTFADGRQRVHVVFRSCVLLFCKTLRQTKDIDNRQPGHILTVTVPAQSDFADGWEHWQIRSEPPMTRVQYHAAFTPAFAVPPIIGPWILKARLRPNVRLMVQHLETPQVRP